jgi:hypothetical protein
MSMLGIVQNFISEVSGVVNGKGNPLGLSAGQMDEINQILTLIKNIISDGIQRGDISKMIVLMGEMAAHMPELKSEIDEIINGLKKLSKKLFEDPESFSMNDSPAQGLLAMEIGLANVDNEGGLLGSNLTSSGQGLSMGDSRYPQLLKETEDDRSKLAERILNLVNDNIVLSQANFEALSKGLERIERRGGLKSVDNPSKHTDSMASDYYVDGNSAAPVL